MREVLAHHAIDPDNDVTIIGLGRRYPQILRLLADGELDGAHAESGRCGGDGTAGGCGSGGHGERQGRGDARVRVVGVA